MLWKVIYFFIMITLTSAENLQLPTGWVDPTHQNYDRKTKTMKEIQFDGNVINPMDEDYNRKTKNIKTEQNYHTEEINGNYNNDIIMNVISENCNKNDILLVLSYYRRAVNLILNNGIINSDDVDSYNFYFSTSIKSDQYDILRKFGNENDVKLETLQDVDMIISELFSKSMKQTFEDISYRWILNIKMFLNSPLLYVFCVIVLIIVWTYILSKTSFSVTKTIGTIIFIIFVIGFVWTYVELIEEAELKQMSDRLQNSELPKDCDLNSMYWWEKIFSKETGNNCHKYIQANYKSAWKTVSPNKVFITMTGSSISDILTSLGKSIINIINITYSELPFPLNLILIVPMMTLILFLLIIAFCSYWGFTFEISMLYNLFHLKYRTQNNATQNTTAPIYISLPQPPHRPVIETVEVNQLEEAIVSNASDSSVECNCNLNSKKENSQKKDVKNIENKNNSTEFRGNDLEMKNKKELLNISDTVSSESDVDIKDINNTCL